MLFWVRFLLTESFFWFVRLIKDTHLFDFQYFLPSQQSDCGSKPTHTHTHTHWYCRWTIVLLCVCLCFLLPGRAETSFAHFWSNPCKRKRLKAIDCSTGSGRATFSALFLAAHLIKWKHVFMQMHRDTTQNQHSFVKHTGNIRLFILFNFLPSFFWISSFSFNFFASQPLSSSYHFLKKEPLMTICFVVHICTNLNCSLIFRSVHVPSSSKWVQDFYFKTIYEHTHWCVSTSTHGKQEFNYTFSTVGLIRE